MRKIAIVSTKPASLTSGTEVRNYHQLKGLKKHTEVDMFIALRQTDSEVAAPLTRIKNLLTGKVPYIEIVRNSTFTKLQLEQIKKADIIQFQELEGLLAMEKYLDQIDDKILVLDAHNVEVHRFLSGIQTESFPMRIIGTMLAKKIAQIEIDLIQKVDLILTCSEVDKNYFGQYFPAENIIVVPNGIDDTYFKNIKPAEKNNLLFMGLLSYGPNNDGLKYYLNEIHQLVKNKVPDVELTIIGKNPPAWLIEKANEEKSIKVKGFVEDIRDEINNAKVCICPLRHGSGTRLKVLEYMAAGKPLVSTHKGAEGIKAEDSVHLLYADTPEEFANKVAQAINDKKLAKKLGENGRKLVEANYSWSKITKELYNTYSHAKKRV